MLLPLNKSFLWLCHKLFNKSFFSPAPLQLCAFALVLSSCGFTPVYQQQNAETTAKFAAIEMPEPKDLVEQVFTRNLSNLLNPENLNAPDLYKIDIKISRGDIALAIQEDRTVTRFKVIMTVKYILTEKATGNVIQTASIKREGEYDKVASDYATYISEEDTVRRIVKELAQDARIRIISVIL